MCTQTLLRFRWAADGVRNVRFASRLSVTEPGRCWRLLLPPLWGGGTPVLVVGTLSSSPLTVANRCPFLPVTDLWQVLGDPQVHCQLLSAAGTWSSGWDLTTDP